MPDPQGARLPPPRAEFPGEPASCSTRGRQRLRASMGPGHGLAPRTRGSPRGTLAPVRPTESGAGCPTRFICHHWDHSQQGVLQWLAVHVARCPAPSPSARSLMDQEPQVGPRRVLSPCLSLRDPTIPFLKVSKGRKSPPPSQSPPLASWNLSCLNLVTQWRERSLSLIGNKAEDPEHLWGSQENPSVAPSGPRWFTCK